MPPAPHHKYQNFPFLKKFLVLFLKKNSNVTWEWHSIVPSSWVHRRLFWSLCCCPTPSQIAKGWKNLMWEDTFQVLPCKSYRKTANLTSSWSLWGDSISYFRGVHCLSWIMLKLENWKQWFIITIWLPFVWNISQELWERLMQFNLGTFLLTFTFHSMLALIRVSILRLC